MSPEEVGKIGLNLKSLLSSDEIVSLFIHLFNKSVPLEIGSKVSRKKKVTYCIGSPINHSFYDDHIETSKFKLRLCSNKKVLIKSIRTFLKNTIADLSLKIYKSDKILNLKSEKMLVHSQWCFNFDYLMIEPNKDYKLVFIFKKSTIDCYDLSHFYKLETKFIQENSNYKFDLKSRRLFHCVSDISFSPFVNQD